MRCDNRPVPPCAGDGRRIVVSQGQNWRWLVNRDGTVAAQGGVVGNSWLPRQHYRTGDQCARPGRARHQRDLTRNLRIDYFVRFAQCVVWFHQTPVSKATGRQIYPGDLAGTDLAKFHGCVRLPRPLIVQLWRFSRKPTEVVVAR